MDGNCDWLLKWVLRDRVSLTLIFESLFFNFFFLRGPLFCCNVQRSKWNNEEQRKYLKIICMLYVKKNIWMRLGTGHSMLGITGGCINTSCWGWGRRNKQLVFSWTMSFFYEIIVGLFYFILFYILFHSVIGHNVLLSILWRFQLRYHVKIWSIGLSFFKFCNLW